MLKRPEITLIALTGKDFPAHDEAIRRSCEGIEWGAVKVIYDYQIQSIDDWNKKIVYDLHNYIRTDFALLIHADGYVGRPEAWRDEFLDYDYIGAPWPLPRDEYSYRDPAGTVVRVGNSVSLRSKRLLETPSKLNLEWKSYYGNTNEDGFICVHNRHIFAGLGMKFAPLDVAKYFSKEHEIPENQGVDTFAFHTVDV